MSGVRPTPNNPVNTGLTNIRSRGPLSGDSKPKLTLASRLGSTRTKYRPGESARILTHGGIPPIQLMADDVAGGNNESEILDSVLATIAISTQSGIMARDDGNAALAHFYDPLIDPKIRLLRLSPKVRCISQYLFNHGLTHTEKGTYPFHDLPEDVAEVQIQKAGSFEGRKLGGELRTRFYMARGLGSLMGSETIEDHVNLHTNYPHIVCGTLLDEINSAGIWNKTKLGSVKKQIRLLLTGARDLGSLMVEGTEEDLKVHSAHLDVLKYIFLDFKDGLYRAKKYHKEPVLKIDDLSMRDVDFICAKMASFAQRIEQRFDLLTLKGVNLKRCTILRGVISSLNRYFMEADSDLLIAGETLLQPSVNKTLYYMYVRNIKENVLDNVKHNSYGPGDDSYLAPYLLKVADIFDNVLNFPNALPKAIRLFRKARCIIREGASLSHELAGRGVDKERLDHALTDLYSALKIGIYIFSKNIRLQVPTLKDRSILPQDACKVMSRKMREIKGEIRYAGLPLIDVPVVKIYSQIK